jgi:hypothetical protein
MSVTPRLGAAWGYVKEYAAAVMAAALMFGGIHQLLSAVKYPISFGVLRFLNAIIRRGFPGHFPLPDYGGASTIPWLFHVRNAAVGIMLIIVGILIAVLANVRNQGQPAG